MMKVKWKWVAVGAILFSTLSTGRAIDNFAYLLGDIDVSVISHYVQNTTDEIFSVMDNGTFVRGTSISDTNASTACAANEFLAGDGVCVSNVSYLKTYNVTYHSNIDTSYADTNASTACAVNEFLAGDGVCVSNTSYLKTYNSSYEYWTNFTLEKMFNASYIYWTNASLEQTYNATYHAMSSAVVLAYTYGNLTGEAQNVNISGWLNVTTHINASNISASNNINATDWTNVTITESQISDHTPMIRDTNASTACAANEFLAGNDVCVSNVSYLKTFNSSYEYWTNFSLEQTYNATYHAASAPGILAYTLTNITGEAQIINVSKSINMSDNNITNVSFGFFDYIVIGTEEVVDTLTINGSFNLIHTSRETNDHAFEIDLNASGFGDVKAIEIFYGTGDISLGDDEGIILIEIDESNASGGDVFAIEVLSTEGLANIYGLKAGALVSPIHQDSGTFTDMDSANVTVLDNLTEFLSSASDIPIFVNDNDYVVIGDANKFQELEFLLNTTASNPGIKPTFGFSTGTDTWSSFTPVDGTSGMRSTGIIAWDDDDIPTWAKGRGSEYLIIINRTQNSLQTVPIEDKIQIAAVTEYVWNKIGDLRIRTINTTRINSSDWTNVTITESQISDLTHVTDTNISDTNITWTLTNITGDIKRINVTEFVNVTGTVNTTFLNATYLNISGCADNEILKVDAGIWVCEADATGAAGGGAAYTYGNLTGQALILNVSEYINVTGNINTTGNVSIGQHLNVTGNITLGQQIMFSLLERIDNFVDGWFRFWGGINMMGNSIINATWVNATKINATWVNATYINGTISGDGSSLTNLTIYNASYKYWTNASLEQTYNLTYHGKPSVNYADTNASTACAVNEFLAGDDVCVSNTSYLKTYNVTYHTQFNTTAEIQAAINETTGAFNISLNTSKSIKIYNDTRLYLGTENNVFIQFNSSESAGQLG